MTKEERQVFKKNLSEKFTSSEDFFSLLGDSNNIFIIKGSKLSNEGWRFFKGNIFI